MSCYAPAWIKTYESRFAHAQDPTGKGLEILSAFSKNHLEADRKAFSELVDYLLANKNSLVPGVKEDWAKTKLATRDNGEEGFGKSLATDGIFQAGYYAKYAKAVAETGKNEYHLPMYVNAAFNYGNVPPGTYPGGGLLSHLTDIWLAGAPAMDVLSPDFHNPYCKHYGHLYTGRSHPLFIPEIKFEPSVAAKVFHAIGHYQSLGPSPFSLESTEHPEDESIGKAYSILSQPSPEILKYRGTGKMEGVLVDRATKTQEIILGNDKLKVSHDYSLGWSPESKNPDWPMSGPISIRENDNDFIIAGTGVVVTFTVTTAKNKSIGILQADKGIYKKWQGDSGKANEW